MEADRQSNFDQIATLAGVLHGTVFKALHEKLEMNKRCCRWVPHHLDDEQRQNRVDVCRILFGIYRKEGRRFLSRVITGDETFAYQHEQESRDSSRLWLEKVHEVSYRAIFGK